jgi:hypothetical protein
LSKKSISLLTALSANATTLCSAPDTACKQYFSPAPAKNLVMACDLETGIIGMKKAKFLHPGTGDLWQLSNGSATQVWVRNNGLVEGRSATVTPTAPTGFFATIVINDKLLVVGGGYQKGTSWSNKSEPVVNTDSSAIANNMELDLVSGRWSDLDRSINGTSRVSPATLRYGHGIAQGPEATAVRNRQISITCHSGIIMPLTLNPCK